MHEVNEEQLNKKLHEYYNKLNKEIVADKEVLGRILLNSSVTKLENERNVIQKVVKNISIYIKTMKPTTKIALSFGLSVLVILTVVLLGTKSLTKQNQTDQVVSNNAQPTTQATNPTPADTNSIDGIVDNISSYKGDQTITATESEDATSAQVEQEYTNASNDAYENNGL